MSVVGAIGVGLQVAGSVFGSMAQQKMVAEQTRASKKAENAREQQMRLESANRRRQAVREAVVGRAMAQSVGVAQGAQYGSGVAGAMANATAQGAENQQVTSATEAIGGRVFEANREYFDATQKGSAKVAMWQGISSLGGAISSNAGRINQIGSYYSGRNQGGLNRGFGG